jgi:hypothetical protein
MTTDARLKFVASVSASEPDTLRPRLGAPIHLAVSPATLGTRAGQALVYQLSTLLARLFDHVRLDLDEDATGAGDPPCLLAIPGLSGSTAEAIRGAALGTRSRADVVAQQACAPYRIRVGASAGPSAGDDDLFVGSTGWSAGLSVTGPVPVLDTTTMVGPLAAGALAAGEAFKHVFADVIRGAVRLSRGGLEQFSLSLLDYRVRTTPFQAMDEPSLADQVHVDLALFGCGSLGCGFLLGALLTPQLTGAVTTVDNGVFDERNPFKYTLLSDEAATAKLPKALWAARMLGGRPGLTVMGFRGTATEYVEAQPVNYRIPLAVSAVDTLDARFAVQDALPGRIINAGVAGTMAQVSVHGFGDGPCLACLGITEKRESWTAKGIAERIGLPVARTRALILGNLPLDADDIRRIREANQAPAALLADVDSFLGEPVMSFYNRAAYAETAVQTAGGTEALVTSAFVSAFGGVLLLAEVLKEASPELQGYRVDNSYRQELLGVPADDRLRYERDASGWCLCHSIFRQRVYRAKYGRAITTSEPTSSPATPVDAVRA